MNDIVLLDHFLDHSAYKGHRGISLALLVAKKQRARQTKVKHLSVWWKLTFGILISNGPGNKEVYANFEDDFEAYFDQKECDKS